MKQTNTNILFVPDTVTIITHIHKQTHSIYIKSHIISSQELSYMFQRHITILRETLPKGI